MPDRLGKWEGWALSMIESTDVWGYGHWLLANDHLDCTYHLPVTLTDDLSHVWAGNGNTDVHMKFLLNNKVSENVSYLN